MRRRTWKSCVVRPTSARIRRRSSKRDNRAGRAPRPRQSAFATFVAEAHAHRVEAGVDIEDLARDAGREIGAEKRSGIPHVLERDVATKRRNLRHLTQHLAEARDA